MCNPVNLLVLDEPTNHLDLPSCDVLEDALDAYPGTVLIVSHDRHLVRNTVDGLIEVRDGRVKVHYEVSERVLSPRSMEATPPAQSKAPTATSSKGAKGTGKSNAKVEQRRIGAENRQQHQRATKDLRKNVDAAERKVMKCEAKIADIQRELADPAVYADGDRVKELVAQLNAQKDQSAELMAQWEAAVTALDRAESRL